tara:strand:- start:2696 stop:3400 length:705 start_codon:yes stop_codon:yes gene_type:complete
MTNKVFQSFYLAIIGHNLHIDYFNSEEENFHHQKKYLMPDTLDDNLNLTILTKFILEKVKDFEKDVGSFIEKVNLITDAKYDQFSLSLKNKFNSNKIKDADVVRLINDAKKLIIRNNKNCFILHILVDKYIVDGKEYFELPENLNYKEFIIDLSFITVQNSIIETLNRVLKDCNIEVKKIISHQYSNRFADKRDTSPCIAGKKVSEGINSSEVITRNVYSKKQGLFEKMFNFFG